MRRHRAMGNSIRRDFINGFLFSSEVVMLDFFIKLHASREPDFYIGGKENPYIKRWWLTSRKPEDIAVYLHNQLRDDDDRALHDHPRDNISIILSGGYLEHTPEGVFNRKAGDVVSRRAAHLHRLELHRDKHGVIVPSWSLFFIGVKVREWGFQCPKGWVHYTQFVDELDNGNIGKGCPE